MNIRKTNTKFRRNAILIYTLFFQQGTVISFSFPLKNAIRSYDPLVAQLQCLFLKTENQLNDDK